MRALSNSYRAIHVVIAMDRRVGQPSCTTVATACRDYRIPLGLDSGSWLLAEAKVGARTKKSTPRDNTLSCEPVSPEQGKAQPCSHMPRPYQHQRTSLGPTSATCLLKIARRVALQSNDDEGSTVDCNVLAGDSDVDGHHLTIAPTSTMDRNSKNA